MTDAKGKDKDKLSNIGPKSAAWLRQVGIRTIEDVRDHGAMAAYLKVKRAGFKPGLNVLYALIGAERGRPMNSLTPEEKAALVLEVAAYDEGVKQSKKQVFEVRDVTAERTAAGPENVRLGTARGAAVDSLSSPVRTSGQGSSTSPDARDALDPSAGVDEGNADARDPLTGDEADHARDPLGPRGV